MNAWGLRSRDQSWKVNSKISQMKSVKLRFSFSQDKRSHGEHWPMKGVRCCMYLKVFLNINAEVPVESGTLPFHPAIPTKHWLSCIYWHQNYHWPKCSSIINQFNLKLWGCTSASGHGLPILHEMKELKKIKKELKKKPWPQEYFYRHHKTEMVRDERRTGQLKNKIQVKTS